MCPFCLPLFFFLGLARSTVGKDVREDECVGCVKVLECSTCCCIFTQITRLLLGTTGNMQHLRWAAGARLATVTPPKTRECYEYTYTYILYVYVCVCVCVCTYIYVYAYTYMHTYIYIVHTLNPPPLRLRAHHALILNRAFRCCTLAHYKQCAAMCVSRVPPSPPSLSHTHTAHTHTHTHTRTHGRYPKTRHPRLRGVQKGL